MAATCTWASAPHCSGRQLPRAVSRGPWWLAASNTLKRESQNPGHRVEVIVRCPIASEQEGCQCCFVSRPTDPTAASVQHLLPWPTLLRWSTGIRKILGYRNGTLIVLYMEDMSQFLATGFGPELLKGAGMWYHQGAGSEVKQVFLSEGRCPPLISVGEDGGSAWIMGSASRTDLVNPLIQWYHCSFMVKLSHS